MSACRRTAGAAPRRLRGGCAGLFALLLWAGAAPGADDGAARQNYMLNCQGCHLPDGSGSAGSVPKMNDFVGYFLHVPGGREFIVQVPGVTSAPLSDQDLAEVMNWLLLSFSGAQLPQPFEPYSAAEISRLRQEPLLDVHQRRRELLALIRNRLNVTEE